MVERAGLSDLTELLRAARQHGATVPEGLVERERLGDDPCRLAGALTLSVFRTNEARQAIEWADEAIGLFGAHDCDCVELEFAAFNMKGVFLDDLGRHDDAIAAFEAGLARAEKGRYFLGISKAQHNLCFQALRKGELHEIVRRNWNMLSHESADPTLRSDAATAHGELLSCIGLYDAAALQHRLAVAESDRGGDMLNGLQARIRLSITSLLAGDLAVGSGVAQDLREWPAGGVERYEMALKLLDVEWMIDRQNYPAAAVALAELTARPSKATGIEGLKEELTRARLHEATGRFQAAIAAAASLDLETQGFSDDRARAEEIIYRASKRLGDHAQAADYGRRICRRLADWCRSLDALPPFEATGELAISRQVAGLHQRHALLDRLAALGEEHARVVAHEVRNAIAPITMIASLLDDMSRGAGGSRAASGHGHERLATMIDQALIKLNFVESRLDVSAPVVVDLSQLDVASVLAEVISSFERTARAKSVELVLTAEPAVVESDRIILDMALSNVISNAIKFTEPGTEVHIRLQARPGPGFDISVLDQGQGFSAGDLERAFEPYAQLSARPTAGESSTGLGLYISRRMLSGVGATIALGNRPDRSGAMVVVTVPARPPGADRTSSDHETPVRVLKPVDRGLAPATSSHQTQCLVVEDSPAIVNLVTSILNEAGIDVIAAASLDDVALLLTNKAHFDLALVDINLGGEPAGPRVVSMLRRDRPLAQIVVTSSLSATDAGRYTSLHGLSFLPKPYGAQSLLRAMLPGLASERTLETIAPGVVPRVAPVEERFDQLAAEAEQAARTRPEVGIDAYRDALAFASLYDHGPGVAIALSRMAELAAAAGRFSGQIDALIELASTDLVEAIERARAHQALGWAYLDRRALARARRMFEAAAAHTPGPSALGTSLAFGLSVCDLLDGGDEGDLRRALVALDGLGELDRSSFAAEVGHWVDEVRAAQAIGSGAAVAVGPDVGTWPRAHLEALARADASPAELLIAGDALDELARRLRRDVQDLFSVYDLFSERAALRNRRDLDAEVALLNDDLFETLRRSAEHTERYVGQVIEILNRAVELTDPAAAIGLADELAAAGVDFDEQARLFRRPKLHTPLPIVVAHLIQATQRLVAERRIVLVWAPLPPGTAIEGSAVGELQAALAVHLANLEPGSTIEVELAIDPPALVIREVGSPLGST